MVNVELTHDLFAPNQANLLLHFSGFGEVKKPSFNRLDKIQNINLANADQAIKDKIQDNAVKLAKDLLYSYLNHEDFFMTIDGMVIKEDLLENLNAIYRAGSYDSFVRLFTINIMPILERMAIIYPDNSDFKLNVNGLAKMMLYCQKVKNFYPLKSVFA